MRKVLVITGSTASGKSDFAIEVAKKYQGEIISCDSVAVYQGMDIGSAKVLPVQQQGVIHHGIDVMDITQQMNVAWFQRYAREKIEEISERGNLPILVGGTGFYLKAILYDYQFLQEEEPERSFDHFTNQQLYDLLKEKDPQQAEKIHINNRKRLIRVHQLMAQSQQTRTEMIAKQDHACLYDVCLFYLTTQRDLLRQRIDVRVDQMFEAGLLNEIETLSHHGALLNYPCFDAIGYREFRDYYQKLKTIDEVKQAIKTHTHQFSKRQLTWFKHQLQGEMIDVLEEGALDRVWTTIKNWINMND